MAVSNPYGKMAMFVLFFIAIPAAEAQPPSDFGGSFSQLQPKQKLLIQRWASEYKVVLKRQMDPQKVYDALPLSARTTFQAVTHALLNTKLTSEDGKSLGTAIDLIDVVERVAGTVPNTRGDRQFRIYVYLKRNAINKLYAAKEFKRGHDNTTYHIGYPINFRQQGGTPSLQFSLARTGLRADIDVDYRSSSPAKALFDGHLTAANSDVRAGHNDEVHNKRWDGLSNWWRDLLAAFVGGLAAEESVEGLAAGAGKPKRNKAKTVHEAVHAYLSDWLIRRAPESLLPVVSIKAYPCVAEFGGQSRPDSKMALALILKRMRERNKSLGVVARLEDVVQPVDYQLPGALTVRHPHEGLFTIQEVHDDIAWALDCRVRYKMQLVESIPRPPHKLSKTHVVSMRVKNPREPEAFLVQTWQQESDEWRLVSFEVTASAAPKDLLPVAPMQVANSDAAEVSTAAEKLLATWLMQRRWREAASFFLPESYSCDAFRENHDTMAKPTKAPDQSNLMRFLEEAVKHAVPNAQLEGVIAPAEASHHEMNPIPHAHSGAFLLAAVSGDLHQMSPCNFDEQQLRKRSPSKPATGSGMVTVFRLVHTRGDETAAVTLHWKKSQGEWAVASYRVHAD